MYRLLLSAANGVDRDATPRNPVSGFATNITRHVGTTAALEGLPPVLGSHSDAAHTVRVSKRSTPVLPRNPEEAPRSSPFRCYRITAELTDDDDGHDRDHHSSTSGRDPGDCCSHARHQRLQRLQTLLRLGCEGKASLVQGRDYRRQGDGCHSFPSRHAAPEGHPAS